MKEMSIRADLFSSFVFKFLFSCVYASFVKRGAMLVEMQQMSRMMRTVPGAWKALATQGRQLALLSAPGFPPGSCCSQIALRLWNPL